ncbi:N-acetylmuramoyl-L-alanine amidase [bacterium]|nr:N-acetylmuramoyl-L-alanine amidase [bacterium]
MKICRIFTIIALLICFGNVESAEISLIYPRIVSPQDTFIYDSGFDSTFVLGNVVPPEGLLKINGHRVAIDDYGAFLAFLPLRKGNETKSWELNLIQQGDSVALTFPYQIAEDREVETTDSMNAMLPAVVEVIAPHSHIRTTAEGSYYLFPPVGNRLRATGSEGEFLTIELGTSTAVIETRFVAFTKDTTVEQSFLGDGVCEVLEDWSVCRFELSAAAIWRAELTPDHRTLDVLLYNAVSRIDRIQFDINDRFVEDIVWHQEPDGLLLSLRLNAPVTRGYHIDFVNGQFEISVRQPFEARDKQLKRKIIVVDAGHGGEFDGAIGPLGNKEKDITLRWAKLLASALEHKGAIVVLTREYDEAKSLYDRIEIARGVHADCFVSLHGNALPDGIDPSTRSGTGTYYYQSLSRNAAESIHGHLLKAGGLRDDGLWDANFAVARPTEFPAVLIEAAYLMHPREERLLMNEEFLSRMANAVVRGLEDYFRE